ncbi:MAG: LysR family transcriptional regulator [Lachnospiraceae bacterium]|nr:LysR family transcriptional regulator [Lachnospiraceae bacterium]
MLDFRIQTFLSVCKHLNFTTAAEELHITQPAVSQHIRYLEHLYQTELFTRDGKKIELTAAGEILLATMTVLRNDEQAMIKRMQLCRKGKRKLIFGVTKTIGEYVIAAPLARYLKLHPETDIHIQSGNTSTLLECLHDGNMDFALVEGYFKSDDYETMVFRSEAFLPVCATNHIFARKVTELKDLTPERLIVREHGSGSRDILERNLAVNNIQVSDFAHIVEVENVHTIVSLLRQDCGISFLYEAAVRHELNKGKLKVIPLTNFHMKHDFTFLWNKGSSFSEEYRRICRELTGNE